MQESWLLVAGWGGGACMPRLLFLAHNSALTSWLTLTEHLLLKS